MAKSPSSEAGLRHEKPIPWDSEVVDWGAKEEGKAGSFGPLAQLIQVVLVRDRAVALRLF